MMLNMKCQWLENKMCDKCTGKCEKYLPSKAKERKQCRVGRPVEQRTLEMIELLKNKEKVRSIAEKYQVSTQYVYQVKKRNSL